MDDFSKLFPTIRSYEGELDSYSAGFNCGKHGPNTTNCHFRFFSTPENTREWERGKKAGEAAAARGEQG